MSDYDVTIKLLIQDSADELLRQLGVGRVTEWLNVELPKVQNRRADLVGRTGSGEIIHFELQSSNDRDMPLRMAEYALTVLRRYKRYPYQLVLFVGNGKLTMRPVLETRGMSFHYDQLDIRELDGGRLLQSRHIADNLLALLTRLQDVTGSIRKVLRNVARLKPKERNAALSLLFALAEVRSLEDTVSEEFARMPVPMIKTSINNKTFGPWIRKGLEKGLEKGRAQGAQRAARLALMKRFGSLPDGINRRLGKLSEAQADEILAGVLDGKSLEELFPGGSGQ